MNFGARHYVPCLRWKQGEYKAVSLLSDAAKELMTPLIEAPEKGFDFETGTDKKSLDDHLEPFAKRVRKHWKQRECFVDLKLIPSTETLMDGVHPVTFVFDELHALGCSAIPVTGIDRVAQYQHEARQSAAAHQRGLCVRINVEDAANADLETSISNVIGQSTPVEQCDLILDLGSPLNFVPLEAFASLIPATIQQLPYLNRWRTLTIIASSFPASMAEIKTTPTTLPRYEWQLYKLLATRLGAAGIRVPTFGDYVINHPDVLQVDMRLVKPSGTIRYTIDDGWLIAKGPNVRDYGYGQYVNHCNTIASSPEYLGPAFSEGDKYISDCSAGTAKTGNLSTWRWVGTNHHLEKVTDDVANFFAP